MMAEATVDKVCEKIGIQRPCRTMDEPLPSPNDPSHPGYHWLGLRLAEIEQERAYGSLICECELSTEAEIRRAIQAGAHTLDDIRRETRLGMGPCQGGFCSFRVTGMLHHLKTQPVETTNAALRDFLQERWKGLIPILWGQQLRQERLDELIYLGVLNLPTAPGPQSTRLRSENYARADDAPPPYLTQEPRLTVVVEKHPEATPVFLDTLVIGAGLAGLAATWRLASQGKKVRCISKGWSSLFWSSGCIDIFGCASEEPPRPVIYLREALQKLVQDQPSHPYTLAGLAELKRAVVALQRLFDRYRYPMRSTQPDDPLAENWLLPTALGALRATCLAPDTMVAGDCRRPQPLILVGFAGYADFYPHFAAANLNAQGIPAQAVWLEIPEILAHRMPTSRILAQQFEKLAFRNQVAAALKEQIQQQGLTKPGLRIGFPAVLGIRPGLETWQALQEALGFPVFEVTGLPPSIPGMRLHQILVRAIEEEQGRVFDGMEALGAEVAGDAVLRVWSESAARNKYHAARSFILATGGILGGGFSLDTDRKLQANVFDIPIQNRDINRTSQWFQEDFFNPEGHPIFRSGLLVDQNFKPCDPSGQPLYHNLAAIGGALMGADPIREHSIEGIALASAWRAAHSLMNIDPTVKEP
jgi:glycerol-3-phosphate dehydrogenase subunit B